MSGQKCDGELYPKNNIKKCEAVVVFLTHPQGTPGLIRFAMSGPKCMRGKKLAKRVSRSRGKPERGV
jgi:hypothetical protein